MTVLQIYTHATEDLLLLW